MIRPRLTEEEYEKVKEYRAIKRASEGSDIDVKDVKHGWIKTKDTSLFFTNKEYEKPDFDIEKIDFDFVVNNTPKLNIDAVNDGVNDGVNEGLFDRLVYTDTHIGMNPNPNGYSLYGGKWDEDELNKRLSGIIELTALTQKSDMLVVDDLGDLMDGWNGETARKGHELPQNMDNQRAFDVALNFKYQLFIELKKRYKNILFNNICNDNHSAAFGYVVNASFKKMVEASSVDGVDVINHRQFINHYRIGNYVFIITHGKDDKHLKFGFKPQLDKPQMEKIDNYIDENYLLQPGVKIEFSKGDSHQLLLDWSSSERFNYFNYPALSPASDWVQTNYKKGKSGFIFFNYKESGCDIKPYFFNWKKH